METKNESGKPGMNRKRRQLLLGAGLAPVVMTLHSAKVFGQELQGGNPSGAAPFSGAIQGSVNVNNVEGTTETERKLYELIANDGTNAPNGKVTLVDYYGSIGSGTSSPYASWSAWDTAEDGQIQWTTRYENTFAPAVNDFKAHIDTIYAAITAQTQFDQATVAAYKLEEADLTVPTGADTAIGIFKYVNDAKSLLSEAVGAYNLMVDAYNSADPAPATPLTKLAY